MTIGIKVKYLDKEMPKLEHIVDNKVSNWIDVRASRVEVNGKPVDFREGMVTEGIEVIDEEQGIFKENRREAIAVGYNRGDVVKVYLGFAMELPEGFEGHTAPRGSTFKHYGLIQTNSIGVVDEAFCGDGDEWFIPFVALKDGVIERFDRVAQFRVMPVMEEVVFVEVGKLNNKDRGSEGNTGKQ